MTSQVIVGVRPVLRRLKQKGAVLGLISGGVGEIVWEKMRRARLKQFFVVGAFGDEAEERVELVRLAMDEADKLMGRKFDKDEAWVVGDTPRDIEAAKANGVKVVAVASGPYTRDELAEYKPDYLIGSLKEMEEIMT